MKKYFILGILISHCLFINGQENFYNYLVPGSFYVAYMDSLIFESKYDYKAFNYNGKKPYFLRIWHPIEKNSEYLKGFNLKESYLTLSDFFEFPINPELARVQQQILKNDREIFIRDYIEENLLTGEANDFGTYSYNDIFQLVSQIRTNSSYLSFSPPINYPVIIYHHGAQSNSFENFAMAEYFASRGFIFVASSFHLPYENSMWGLKPFDRIIKNEDEESLKSILNFARSLSTSPYIFFMGHSLGAQMGFRTFDQDTILKGMVSLETTIEFQEDSNRIKELWPEVFEKIATENAFYPFPVMLCAATGKEGAFNFFNDLNADQTTYVSTESSFEHNAYTSLFYLRLFLSSAIIQSDKDIIEERLHLYIRHLELIYEFLTGIMEEKSHPMKATYFISKE